MASKKKPRGMPPCHDEFNSVMTALAKCDQDTLNQNVLAMQSVLDDCLDHQSQLNKMGGSKVPSGECGAALSCSFICCCEGCCESCKVAPLVRAPQARAMQARTQAPNCDLLCRAR